MIVTSSLVCVVACSEEGDEGGHLVAVSARAAREEHARGQADVPLLSRRRCSACTPRVFRHVTVAPHTTPETFLR